MQCIYQLQSKFLTFSKQQSLLSSLLPNLNQYYSILIANYIQSQMSELLQLLSNIIHEDMFHAIDVHNLHSVSVIDLFSILDRIKETLYRYMSLITPYAAEMLLYFKRAIHKICLVYSVKILKNCQLSMIQSLILGLLKKDTIKRSFQSFYQKCQQQNNHYRLLITQKDNDHLWHEIINNSATCKNSKDLFTTNDHIVSKRQQSVIKKVIKKT